MPYLPDHDLVTDRTALLEFIGTHPLATLIAHQGDRLDADLVPLLAEEYPGGVRLVGHVARANPLWRPGPRPVLALFGPEDHYVSPSFYPGKTEHHRAVPTWAYLVVQAHGRLAVHDDVRWVRGVVAKLTNAMESGRETPWRMAQAPEDYLRDLLGEIVGISIDVTELTGKFKVNRHKSEADRLGSAEGIAAETGPAHRALIEAMRTRPRQH